MPNVVSGEGDALKAVAGLADDPLEDGWAAIAAEGEAVASRFAPRKAGTLSSGVVGLVTPHGAAVTVRGRAVAYAGPINYGWRRRNIEPASFLQRADAALIDRAPALLEHDLDDAIKRRGLA